MTFIESNIASKIVQMLKYYQSMNTKSFDSLLIGECTLIKIIPNTPYDMIHYGLHISEKFCGNFGSLHKGAISTLVDVLPALHF